MRFALFKEVPKRERRKKRKLNTGAATVPGEDETDAEDDDDAEGSDDEQEEVPQRMPDKSAKAPAQNPPDVPVPPAGMDQPDGSTEPGGIRKER